MEKRNTKREHPAQGSVWVDKITKRAWVFDASENPKGEWVSIPVPEWAKYEIERYEAIHGSKA